MRLFLAFTISDYLKEKIYQQIEFLSAKIRYGIKWVEQENLHITLRFLGDTKEEKIYQLKSALNKVANNHRTTIVSLNKMEVIPNVYRARLIWYSVKEHNDYLPVLFSEMEMELTKLGFKKSDHPLNLHITLGRMKTRIKANWQEILSQVEHLTDDININKIVLMKSTLTKSGPIYKELQSFPLMEKER
ncbi:MAG: RNA 2',3'-cyclic phosphodiesterase [Candidatus Cloacimonadota bacterium]|nr:MAG: RNA 2',3'-cyclic phosphodiesterase [Candidatus Cloacimonadota bacterium]